MRSISSFKYNTNTTLWMRDNRDKNYNRTIFRDMKSIMYAHTNGIGLTYKSVNLLISFVNCMYTSCIHPFTLGENAEFCNKRSIDYQVTNRLICKFKGRL